MEQAKGQGQQQLPGNSLDNLPGLGPASCRMLMAAGIHSAGELRRHGSVHAYLMVRRSGAKTSLNLLWALEGALTGQHWQDVARRQRTSLLLALEQAGADDHRPAG